MSLAMIGCWSFSCGLARRPAGTGVLGGPHRMSPWCLMPTDVLPEGGIAEKCLDLDRATLLAETDRLVPDPPF